MDMVVLPAVPQVATAEKARTNGLFVSPVCRTRTDDRPPVP